LQDIYSGERLLKLRSRFFMSKNNHTNHSNHLENHDLDNFSKTGYSNSRLDAHTVCISDPKLSFDAMTIVGNLNRDNAQALRSEERRVGKERGARWSRRDAKRRKERERL